MKCNKCPALQLSGEGISECAIGGDEHSASWKDGSVGCTLHPMTIAKCLRAKEKTYEDIAEYTKEKDMLEQYGIDVSDRDGKYVYLATCCIGLAGNYSKVYLRHERKFYKAYRNHYDAGGNDIAIWDALVKIGYAYKNMMYHLTPAGFRWLSRVLDITIKERK